MGKIVVKILYMMVKEYLDKRISESTGVELAKYKQLKNEYDKEVQKSLGAGVDYIV